MTSFTPAAAMRWGQLLGVLCQLFISTSGDGLDGNKDTIGNPEFLNRIASDRIKRKLHDNNFVYKGGRPKNVILFIGDGMGIAAVTSYRIMKNMKNKIPYLHKPVFFETFAYAGLTKTNSFDHHVTDSAASAVALVTGRKVDSATLGLLPGLGLNCSESEIDHIQDGIADLAIQKGLGVGDVSNTRLTHATPASLYAKGVPRNFEYDGNSDIVQGKCKNDISSQILRRPASEFTVLMGGGSSFFMSKKRGGLRNDGKDIDIEWQRLGGRRKVLRSSDDLKKYNPVKGEKVLGIFAKSNLAFIKERKASSTEPTVTEMTRKAIEILSRNDNGFFLLVEGQQ
ncbi:hypothetical protein Q1695_006677 [Nippostrongylus brasiliensis]|nr:hypothetical protein Q1695_006677 [Nippostrongylus brasiliensis]